MRAPLQGGRRLAQALQHEAIVAQIGFRVVVHQAEADDHGQAAR